MATKPVVLKGRNKHEAECEFIEGYNAYGRMYWERCTDIPDSWEVFTNLKDYRYDVTTYHNARLGSGNSSAWCQGFAVAAYNAARAEDERLRAKNETFDG